MGFRRRTVFLFITFMMLAMFAGSLLTLTIIGPLSLAAEKTEEVAVELPVRQVKDLPAAVSEKELEKLVKAYELIQNRFLHQVDKNKLIDGAINGMVTSLEDPFTSYMDPSEAEQFMEALDSSFQGIGAEVTLDEGRVKVISPIKGAPADKSGIQVGDIIVSVNGERLDGLKLSEAVMKIRGPKGTQAKLEILRGSSLVPIQVIVVRDDIPLETIYAEMLPGDIGKIEVRQFLLTTAKRFHEEVAKLEKMGMKGLIIDVRNDPGGILSTVVDMMHPFVPAGKPILYIEGREGEKEATISKGPGKPYPVTVLINKGSASASEILAAAMKESAGAVLIGESTYGKGTVQITFEKELGDGSSIKMTVFKWLTPLKNWVNKTGVAPDIEVRQPEYFNVAPLQLKIPIKLDVANDDVINVQLMLTALGYDPGRTDGYYNEMTEKAVKVFQEKQLLPVTGEVDRSTADKLEQETYKELRKPEQDLQLKTAVEKLEQMIIEK
jgi:carboxyl-terminal processing protease